MKLYLNYFILDNPDPDFDSSIVSIFDIGCDKLFDMITPAMKKQNGKFFL